MFKYLSYNTHYMALVVRVKDEVVKRFREAVKNKLGEGKGVFNKAVEEAVRGWIKEKKTN